MPDVKELYEQVTRQAPPRPGALERQWKRQARHTMNRKLGVFAVAAAIAGLAFLVIRLSAGGGVERPVTPADTGPSVVVPQELEVDHVLDLDTGETFPLPDAIIRTLELDEAGRDRCVAQYRQRCSPQYAASPGGALLAYVGAGDDGSPQIFVAGRSAGESPGPAGTEPRQVTHDPIGAASPAWSPDGTRIAYVGHGASGGRGLFVLEVTTGEATPVLDGAQPWAEPQFTPDGASLLYTGGSDTVPVLRIVAVTGGTSRLFMEPGRGLNDAGNGSLSPDGSLVTYLGSGTALSPDGSPLTYHGKEITHAGPGRFLSNVDSTGFRFLPGHVSNPAGTWSPDGTRIVCSGADGVSGGGVIVVDVATGDITHATSGRSAIWLDDQRLLVEV